MPQDQRAFAPQPDARHEERRVPGTWTAIAIAGLSALGFGYWTQAGGNTPGAAADLGRLAEVAPEDVPNALATVDKPPKQLAELKDRKSCNDRLAWVTIMRGPGQPAGRIRLQSGGYISPAFELTDAPVRVALPYPAPYQTGRGTLSVVGTTTDAIVALTPPWHVSAQGGVHAKEVTWTPVGDCPAKG